jgi:hypothetical protein
MGTGDWVLGTKESTKDEVLSTVGARHFASGMGANTKSLAFASRSNHLHISPIGATYYQPRRGETLIAPEGRNIPNKKDVHGQGAPEGRHV